MMKKIFFILCVFLTALMFAINALYCAAFSDYEKEVSEIKNTIQKSPNAENADALYYKLAELRLSQLELLAKQNDIESARLFMKVNEEYLNEAMVSLDKAQSITKSKALILDIYFLKFLIAKQQFQKDREEALFNEIAAKIPAYSENNAENKVQLERICDKFSRKDLESYALRLKIAYASKTGNEGAREIAKEIKQGADNYFKKGDMKKAEVLYKHYIELGGICLDKSTISNDIIETGDKYFENKRYDEAITYYELYLGSYTEGAERDYSSYKIALSLYLNREYDKAALQFDYFLKTYPKSQWFDEAFRRLSKLYFERLPHEESMGNLKKIMAQYADSKKLHDYPEMLIGLLYYGREDNDQASKQFNKVIDEYPDSNYAYAAGKLLEDIEKVKKGEKPYFPVDSKDTVRRWDPYSPIETEIVPEGVQPAAPGSLYTNKVETIDKKGDVKVLPKGEKEWVDMKADTALKSGDAVKTGPSSSCDIAFDEGKKNVIGVMENSEIIIAMKGDEKIELIDADIYAKLSSLPKESSFEIKTPNAVCGMRGTSLEVRADKETTEVAAFENDIYIKTAKQGEQVVKQGYSRSADNKGVVTAEAEITPEKIKKFESWDKEKVYITVTPGQQVSFAMNKLMDVDKFGRYIRDETDESRMPRFVEEEKKEDLLSIEWTANSGGFKDNKQSIKKVWQAPEAEGPCIVSCVIDDMGLVRMPDEGERKDTVPKEVKIFVTVKK